MVAGGGEGLCVRVISIGVGVVHGAGVVVRGMGTWWVQRRNEWGMVSSLVGNWA